MKKTLTLTCLLAISFLVFFPTAYATEPPSITITFEMEYESIPTGFDFPELNLHGWSTEPGTFVMQGDFEDSGSVTETFDLELNLLGLKAHEFKGIIDFVGSQGTFALWMEGNAWTDEYGITHCEGEWTVMSGSDDYSGWIGEGTFESTVIPTGETTGIIIAEMYGIYN